MSKLLPKSAKVVVIGGGVAGCSVAYHLAKYGWKDTILLERDQLTSGTTWHAAGLVGQLGASATITKLRKYSLNLYKELGNGYTYLGFNLKKAPFNDVNVRQAINYAIDKDEVIKGVLLGLGEPIASPYKPGTRWNNPNLQPYPYSPKKALDLLKKAGYAKNEDGYFEKNGKVLAFEILTNQNKQREMTAVLVQRRLKEIGIEVTIRVLEWASFINQYIRTGDFNAVVLGWSLSLDPDQFNIWHSSQQGPGQFNFIGYENSQVDKLLELGRKELNQNKREKIYHQFSPKL